MKMYSTETALLQYNEQLLKNIDRGFARHV